MRIRPESCCDFYKTGHIRQYEPGTELVYSNFTPRSTRLAPKIAGVFDDKIVHFGLQGFIKEFLIEAWNENFFKIPKAQVLARFKARMDSSLGPNAVSTAHIAALHDLGYLPIRIKSLPEGAKVPARVPLFTIVNTRADFFWLTNFLETLISAEMWQPINSATTAWKYRLMFEKFAAMTGGAKEFIPWQGHDFSMRGMGGVHAAAKSGAGHLLSFLGTDTIPAIDWLEDYYNASKTFVGGSVPATEHSVACMGGQEMEGETFRRIICDVYPTGVVSFVGDTWNLWNLLTKTAVKYRQEILARKPNDLGLAKVVFRPDSGDPADILCGNPDAPKDSPEELGVFKILEDIFGSSTNAKGYRTVNPRVGAIYGDSITLYRQRDILERLADKGFASDNPVLGIGSYTYQYCTRDSLGIAVKSTYGIVNATPRILEKDPITDSGTKKSARGLLRVERDAVNGYKLVDNVSYDQEKCGELVTVFEDGRLMSETSLEEIRGRLFEV